MYSFANALGYAAYEAGYAAVTPARAATALAKEFWQAPFNPMATSWLGRTTAAGLDLFETATRRYPKPEWGRMDFSVNGHVIPVDVEPVLTKDFGVLLRFKRDAKALAAARGHDRPDPRVLLVAPLSGHHATLLRGTVEAMLPEHDVYITDWIDAKLAPVHSGRFDLNDYIDYIIDFLRHIGPKAHAIAVCQPGPALLSAAAVLAEDDDPVRPATITIMGSPIDARRSPTVPNKLACQRPFGWFKNTMIFTTPPPYPGMFRRVYPGFVQLYSFLSMNSSRHVNAHYDYFEHLVDGDGDSAAKHREFYDEYLSVLDLTEEFYLQTILEVFQEFKLPKGEFMHRGRLVRPEAITDIALMTVEGENDDISGIGQTQAAHDLCVNIPAALKVDHVQPKVGHYGVFNGSRWRQEIQPQIANFIRRRFDVDEERSIRALRDNPHLRVVTAA